MSSIPLAETEEDVFDLTEAVPETQRLDSSLQKAKAQLSIKTRRHRPSRSRLQDSLSSTEGDDSLDGKLSSSPARRDPAFTLDPFPASPERRAQEEGAGRHVTSTSSQEALLPAASGFSIQPCTRSENSSPAHLRQGGQPQLHERDHSLLRQREHSQSEDDSHELCCDEPGSPTVLLDKKTKRSFLNLGVTLRRTYGKVRKDRSNRLSTGNRETEKSEACSSRTSGPPFVPFSWFSDRLRSSSSPKASSQSTATILSEGSGQEEESEHSLCHLEVPTRPSRPERSPPYSSLGDPLEEEECEGSGGTGPGLLKKKTILPFSASGREKQNGVHSRRDGGHKEDGQKLLTT
ncbi:sterile alpha motif domain-containing protein 14 [Brachyhypopomus gauderio]|uniref:sterile alpha motif domain-containing protein 14 n=1 Tax=Brachyhypopomus gauderio TaxID=698409 RepID=UPI00404287E1